MLIKIKVDKLTPHPRNEEFFDNITGENWNEFLKSIETSGVIEPIVCTKDSVIVSGHQRVRACQELGINEIACDIRDYDDEDKVLKDLIETNLRQRGIGNPNPVKMGRCIKELERIYGISHGGDRKSSLNFSNLKTQGDIASEFNIDQTQLINYKKLLKLIPELQELIETGEMPASIGYRVWARLPEQEQRQLVESLGTEYLQSLTQKQTETLVSEWKQKTAELEEQVLKLQSILQELQEQKDASNDSDRIAEYENHITNLKVQIEELQNRQPQYVFPADYQDLVKFKKTAEPKLARLEEQDRLTEENRDKIRNASELYYMAQDKVVTANGKITNFCHRIEREVGSALSSIRGQCEVLEWNLEDITLSRMLYTKRNIDEQFKELLMKLNKIEMEENSYVEID